MAIRRNCDSCGTYRLIFAEGMCNRCYPKKDCKECGRILLLKYENRTLCSACWKTKTSLVGECLKCKRCAPLRAAKGTLCGMCSARNLYPAAVCNGCNRLSRLRFSNKTLCTTCWRNTLPKITCTVCKKVSRPLALTSTTCATCQRRLTKYGSGVVEIAAYQGNCQACNQRKAVHMDHCHKTKTVRGWLCAQCNVGIGAFKDDPMLMRSAIQYLQRSNA